MQLTFPFKSVFRQDPKSASFMCPSLSMSTLSGLMSLHDCGLEGEGREGGGREKGKKRGRRKREGEKVGEGRSAVLPFI